VTDIPTTVEELEILAQKGAIALVGAMATGAFQAARAGVARLFGRLGPDRQTATQTQLDEEDDLITGTDEAGRDEVRKALAPVWGIKLARLLKDQPGAESELRDLIARVRAALPEAQQQWVQHITASGQAATASGAMFGNVTHYHLADRQAPPVPGDAGEAGYPR
jgi:hypothetical protein